MGKYINKDSKGNNIGTTFIQKVTALKEDGGTVVELDDLQYMPNLICVVDNGMFAAAGWCYDEQEYNAFKYPDGRRKLWMTHPNVEKIVD